MVKKISRKKRIAIAIVVLVIVHWILLDYLLFNGGSYGEPFTTFLIWLFMLEAGIIGIAWWGLGIYVFYRMIKGICHFAQDHLDLDEEEIKK